LTLRRLYDRYAATGELTLASYQAMGGRLAGVKVSGVDEHRWAPTLGSILEQGRFVARFGAAAAQLGKPGPCSAATTVTRSATGEVWLGMAEGRAA